MDNFEVKKANNGYALHNDDNIFVFRHKFELIDFIKAKLSFDSMETDEDFYFWELSVRTMNALKSEGLTTLTKISEKKASDFMRIPNFGKKSLRELNEFAQKNGIQIKGVEVFLQ